MDVRRCRPSAEKTAGQKPLSQLMAQGKPHSLWFAHRRGLKHARSLVQDSALHVGCNCVSENGIARLHSAKHLAVSALDKERIKAPETLAHTNRLEIHGTR